MTEHQLTIIAHEESLPMHFIGECICGWRCQRSRIRDVRRMFRKAHAEEAAKRATEIVDGIFQNPITVGDEP